MKKKVDTIILGCTHYPLLKKAIQHIVTRNVGLIDSATATAREVKKMLQRDGLVTGKKRNARYQFYVSDAPKRFQQLGQRFLGKTPMWIKKIDLDEKKYV